MTVLHIVDGEKEHGDGEPPGELHEVRLWISEGAMDVLTQMVASGVFGEDEDEVAKYLLYKGLREGLGL